MIYDIPNNHDYDMPEDSFFGFYFLSHKDRIFTAKRNLKAGEIVTAFLNIDKENMKRIFDLTISFAGFADNNMFDKNEKTMAEFVDRIIEIEKTAVTLPPYCFVNIDMEKEAACTERMKSEGFYTKIYDITSDEYAEYQRYKKLFSGYGISLYIIFCCISEMSDVFFAQVKRRDEDNYTAAWGAFNELSTLPAQLEATVPYYEKAGVKEIMDVSLGMSGMADPDGKGKLIMVDTYEFHNPQSVIQFDLLKAVQYRRAPIRCRNCGRFFLAEDGYKTFYCNQKSPENPDRTCRQIGAKNRHKEKSENNPIIQTYSKARNRYYQQKFRGSISQEDYKKILRYLEAMRDKAIRGKNDECGQLISYKTLKRLFEKETLFKTLNIGGDNDKE